MHRKRVFLTGNLVWAVATMLYPEDRQPMVSLTFDDIIQFAERIARDPGELSFVSSTSSVTGECVGSRTGVRGDKSHIKPEELIAGAEMLKAAAEELRGRTRRSFLRGAGI